MYVCMHLPKQLEIKLSYIHTYIHTRKKGLARPNLAHGQDQNAAIDGDAVTVRLQCNVVKYSR